MKLVKAQSLISGHFMTLKDRVSRAVESQQKALIGLSLKIFKHPELAFNEVRASTWLKAYLEKKGFQIEMGTGGLSTAFRATYGKGKPHIAFLAEYDALAGLGHGCGHNLIGPIAAGGAVAARLAIDKYGGCLEVIGTPAEEGSGGKVLMMEKGVFNDLDCALLVHPGSRNAPLTGALACLTLQVEFFGKEVHAAARPEEGINALEAMILAYNSINSLRQHIKDSSRIHGIITHGGDAPNVVPGHTAATFLVRAEQDSYLDILGEKVLSCFKGASQATGARLEYGWEGVRYAALKANRPLAEIFGKNLESLHRTLEPYELRGGFGSTDMGNVSSIVPAIHPTIAIASRQVSTHSKDFAAAASSELGFKGLIDGAKSLGMTVVDLFEKPENLVKIKEEFLKGE